MADMMRIVAYTPVQNLTGAAAMSVPIMQTTSGLPLGMQPGDPLPLDVSRLTPGTFVGEVVMSREITPLLSAALDRGCATQVGTDMLFEQIPAYLEFFGLPSTTPQRLRELARIAYR